MPPFDIIVISNEQRKHHRNTGERARPQEN
jgi:hypothetical protein